MGQNKARILIGLVAFVALTVGCGIGASQPRADTGKPAVVAAFYPLEFAAEVVGADLIETESLTAPGVEPHDLELSSDQVQMLSAADLVVFVGSGFQPALEDAISGLEEARRLDVLEGIDVHKSVGEDAHEESTVDPHVWLDPSIMAAIVDQISTRLTRINAAHAETYEANAEKLKTRLVDLDDEYSDALRTCRSRDIVTSHAAFGYLAARYDLNQISISGIDPEGEPSPGRLADVARFVKEHDVSTIFFEELVSPEVAETIAAETGATTAMLSPLESEPESGDYADAMRANLSTLIEALDCG
jgi:zinc transport system substrate-binding protein